MLSLLKQIHFLLREYAFYKDVVIFTFIGVESLLDHVLLPRRCFLMDHADLLDEITDLLENKEESVVSPAVAIFAHNDHN